MKKINIVMMIMLFSILLTQAVYAESRGNALIVHGTAEGILEGDQAVADQLTSYGFDVDAMLAVDCDENTWENYKIVFIGESVTSADVGTKFTAADCVVIVSEPGNYDELLLGNYDTQYDVDNVYSKGKYLVVNDVTGTGLTSFEGFSGEEVAPGFLLEWGKGGIVVVENELGSPAVTIFAPNAELFDGSAAINYRIQWFFRGQGAALATADTWKVFKSVVDYVLPLPVEETESETVSVPETGTEQAVIPEISAQTADLGFTALFAAAAAASAGLFTLKRRR